MSDPGTGDHPEQALEAYSLHALGPQETDQVEAHLEVCSQCRQYLSRLEETAAFLALSAPQEQPPPALRSSIISALPAPAASRPVAASARHPGALAGRVSSWALPVAAGLAIVLFGLSVAMNLHISQRVDQLEEENSTFATRLDQSISETSRMQDAVRQVRSASYFMARPDTHPMFLRPPGNTGSSEGVLLVGNGGRKAVLMVAGLKDSPSGSVYRVWLVRQGQRIAVGTLTVDDTGWGALNLAPPEPVFLFDWVGLTVDKSSAPGSEKEEMVLQSEIVSPDGAK